MKNTNVKNIIKILLMGGVISIALNSSVAYAGVPSEGEYSNLPSFFARPDRNKSNNKNYDIGIGESKSYQASSTNDTPNKGINEEEYKQMLREQGIMTDSDGLPSDITITDRNNNEMNLNAKIFNKKAIKIIHKLEEVMFYDAPYSKEDYSKDFADFTKDKNSLIIGMNETYINNTLKLYNLTTDAMKDVYINQAKWMKDRTKYKVKYEYDNGDSYLFMDRDNNWFLTQQSFGKRFRTKEKRVMKLKASTVLLVIANEQIKTNEPYTRDLLEPNKLTDKLVNKGNDIITLNIVAK